MDPACTEVSEIFKGWTENSQDVPKRAGDVWYIVSKKWLSSFREYISVVQHEGNPAPWPGPLNNSDIIDTVEGGETAVYVPDMTDCGSPDWRHDIKPDIPSSEYESVPPLAWKFLTTHFPGGPEIPRMCAQDPSGSVQLETPIHVSVVHEVGNAGAVLIKAPPSLSYSSLLSFTLKCYGLDGENGWTLMDRSGDANLNFGDVAAINTDASLAGIGVQNEMTLHLQSYSDHVCQLIAVTVPATICEDDGSDTEPAVQRSNAIAVDEPLVQRLQLPATQSSLSCFRTADVMTEGQGQLPGFVGLQNLGNTCYMNSALQCLNHCVPVLRVFLSGDFVKDLNPDNPLGKKGEMAQAFGELAQKLWHGNVQHVSPEGFKRTLGHHAAQFQGCEQHDSQEFLSYLLDMLHEDLNRVRNKPYIEEGEETGRSDEELADEAWTSYRARNDSAIVDHFQGLLKSTLDCPNCGHHKRKFDPFMYLSVPLPGANTELRRFTLVPMTGNSRPQEYCVKLYKHDTVAALLERVAQMIGMSTSFALKSLTAVLQKSSYNAYSRDHEYCSLQILEDTSKELPPERPSYSKEKLLVYQHAEMSVDESCYKLAAIVPPGGTDSLPLLLRVPDTDIAVERVMLTSTRVGQTSGCKRLSLRSDCKLARRVEGLLSPYKKQRLHSNLVYTAPDTDCADDSPDVSVTDEHAIGSPRAVVTDVEMSHSFSDNTVRLSPVTGAAVSMEKASGSVAVGVPVPTVTPVLQLKRPQSDHRMVGDRLHDEAAVKPSVNADIEDDLPAGPMDEDCPPSVSCGLRGGHAHDAPMESAADGPMPDSLRPKSSVEAARIIALPYVPKQELDGLGTGADAGRKFVMDTSPMESSHALQDDSADLGRVELPPEPSQPAVRLLAVQSNGQPRYTQPSENEAHFFRLDVRMEDARQVMDVEAMTKVEEHSSLRQLQEQHDYTLEDCIGAYLDEEVLGPADLWHCPKCRTDVRAKKALDVWCLPEVLIIHLKRFSYSGYGYYSTTSSKINNLVTFPLQGLDMTTFVHGNDPESVYDCFAVSNHMGSVSGGHYTAYCLHEQALIPSSDTNPGWHTYNDRHVMPTSATGVVTPSAYVLFYRRRSSSQADAEDTLAMCRRKLQQRVQEQVPQAGSMSSGTESNAGNAKYALRDMPAPTSRTGSRAAMLADIAELGEDFEQGTTPRNDLTNPANLASTSPAPLVPENFPQAEGMQATDTDSQEAVIDFEISPPDIHAPHARDFDHSSVEKRPGSSRSGQDHQSKLEPDARYVLCAEAIGKHDQVTDAGIQDGSDQFPCGEHGQGVVGFNLPVKNSEVSDGGVQADDCCMQVGTPDNEVHYMT